jgi:hypothetical protein
VSRSAGSRSAESRSAVPLSLGVLPSELRPEAQSGWFLSGAQACSSSGSPCRRGEAPGGAKCQGGGAPRGDGIHSGGHQASESDDGDELERTDEGWLEDGASAGTPC